MHYSTPSALCLKLKGCCCAAVEVTTAMHHTHAVTMVKEHVYCSSSKQVAATRLTLCVQNGWHASRQLLLCCYFSARPSTVHLSIQFSHVMLSTLGRLLPRVSPRVQYGWHSVCVHSGAAAEAAVSIKPLRVWCQSRGQLLPVQQVRAGGMAPAQAPGKQQRQQK
jgi:hypothetical protein